MSCEEKKQYEESSKKDKQRYIDETENFLKKDNNIRATQKHKLEKVEKWLKTAKVKDKKFLNKFNNHFNKVRSMYDNRIKGKEKEKEGKRQREKGGKRERGKEGKRE